MCSARSHGCDEGSETVRSNSDSWIAVGAAGFTAPLVMLGICLLAIGLAMATICVFGVSI